MADNFGAEVGNIFPYNVGVTPDELWTKVGLILKAERERLNLTPDQAAERAGIDANTIRSIDSGDVKTVSKLQAYALSLGITCVDVIVTAIEDSKTPLTPEARRMLSLIEGMSWKARRALLDMAEVIAEGKPPEDRR